MAQLDGQGLWTMVIELMQFSIKSRAGCYITDAITCWNRIALLQGGLWDSLDRQSICELLGGTGDWHRMPRWVVDAPSLETSKIRLNKALRNPIKLRVSPFIAEVWTRWPLKAPFQHKLLYDFNAGRACRTLQASPGKYRLEETEQFPCSLCRAGVWLVLCLQNLPAKWTGHSGDGAPSCQNHEWPVFPVGLAHRHTHTQTWALGSNPKPTCKCKAESHISRSLNSQNVHWN